MEAEKEFGDTFILGMNSKAGTIIAIFGVRRKDSGMRISSSYRFSRQSSLASASTRRKEVNIVVKEVARGDIEDRHVTKHIHRERF